MGDKKPTVSETGMLSDLYDPSGKIVDEILADYRKMNKKYGKINTELGKPSHSPDDSVIYGVTENCLYGRHGKVILK